MLQKNSIDPVILWGSNYAERSIGNRNAAHFQQQHRFSILRRRSEAMPQGTPRG
jgi:hypothetical protein